MALQGEDALWTTGRFFGRADFDPSSEAVELNSLGGSDLFVAPYLPASGALRAIPAETPEQ
ncbi:MAG TPA: hypothetical protein PLL69_07515 [Gemmatimonadales bacterium]|nr:hypothetical protein [Gemmatimonadales bacterium]